MFTWEILQQGGRIEIYLNGGVVKSWGVDSPYHYKLLAKQLLEIEQLKQVNNQVEVKIDIEEIDFIYTNMKRVAG